MSLHLLLTIHTTVSMYCLILLQDHFSMITLALHINNLAVFGYVFVHKVLPVSVQLGIACGDSGPTTPYQPSAQEVTTLNNGLAAPFVQTWWRIIKMKNLTLFKLK